MSDWGSYLKNAVANVEQQLDKVLLEQNDQKNTAQPKTQPKPRSTRPDLAERLKRATNGTPKHSTPEKSTSELPKVENNEGEDTGSKDTIKDAGDPGETDNKSSLPSSHQNASGVPGNENNDNENKNETQGEPEPSSEIAESKELIELITNTTFEIAPSLSDVTLEARKLALAVQRDDALTLVDHLEKIDEEMNAYIDSISTRFSSLHSKARLLSTTRADLAADSQQRQVALLMEEGQRLSQQELKLNLLVKKLRSERNAAVTKADSASSKLENLETQAANSNAELKLKSASLNELEGMVEHFRISAESANKMLDSQLQQDRQASNDSTGRDVAALAEERLSVERSKWNIVEADLLARISELENQTDARSTQFTRLQHSLQEAQQISRESREQMADLQDRLDATVEQHSIEDSRLQREVNELKVAQELLRSQLSASENRNNELETKLHLSQEQFEEQLKEQHHHLTYKHPFEFGEADITYDDVDPVTTVGPSGPFGEYANEYHQPDDTRSLDGGRSNYNSELGEEPTTNQASLEPKDGVKSENASASREVPDISIDGITSLPSNLDLSSRRESSLVGQDSLLGGSNLSLVKRLTLQVRKLENELSVSQKSYELAKIERDEFQVEIETMLDTQEQLNQAKVELNDLSSQTLKLNEKISELNAALGDKNERIDELEQDVRDLKEMYKEQVETLVNEIETIRRG